MSVKKSKQHTWLWPRIMNRLLSVGTLTNVKPYRIIEIAVERFLALPDEEIEVLTLEAVTPKGNKTKPSSGPDLDAVYDKMREILRAMDRSANLDYVLGIVRDETGYDLDKKAVRYHLPKDIVLDGEAISLKSA